MELRYLVTLSICFGDRTWIQESVEIELTDQTGDGHTEGEIWEAAHDQFNIIYDNEKQKPIVAIGLIEYENLGPEENDIEGE